MSKFQSNVATILSEREFLENGLRQMNIIKKIHPSDANFILFVVPKAQQMYKNMADAGIVCRYRGMETHCDECLRVTVGTREENEVFLALLTEHAQKLCVV